METKFVLTGTQRINWSTYVWLLGVFATAEKAQEVMLLQMANYNNFILHEVLVDSETSLPIFEHHQ